MMQPCCQYSQGIEPRHFGFGQPMDSSCGGQWTLYRCGNSFLSYVTFVQAQAGDFIDPPGNSGSNVRGIKPSAIFMAPSISSLLNWNSPWMAAVDVYLGASLFCPNSSSSSSLLRNFSRPDLSLSISP